MLKKILITGPEITNNFTGGVQTHIRNFLDCFKDHSDISITFFAITLGLYNKEKWLTKIFRNVYLLIPFIKAARNHDLVHLNSTFDTRAVIRDVFYALITILLLKKAVLIQFHGGRPNSIKLFKMPIIYNLLKFIFSRTKNILILSSTQANEFNSCFPTIKYTIVPNFIDTEIIDTKKYDNKFVKFLFLSRINETKGIKEIIKAACILKKQGIKCEIIICGDGPLKEWLENSILENNLSNFVHYIGIVTGKRKDDILNSSDVLLLPTSHREGFPYTILEALKYSIPVVSTYEGAIPEVIKNDYSGFLIPPKDADLLAKKMIYFCNNIEVLQVMGKNARKTLEENYSIAQMRNTFSSIYLKKTV